MTVIFYLYFHLLHLYNFIMTTFRAVLVSAPCFRDISWASGST